jgi:hypothetical protein
MQHVLPKYPDIAEHAAELVVSWDRAPDHFGATDKELRERTFRAAVAARDARPAAGSVTVPLLVLGTMACERVLAPSGHAGPAAGSTTRRHDPGAMI